MYEFFLRIHSIKVRKLFRFLVMNLIFSSMEHFIYCQLFSVFQRPVGSPVARNRNTRRATEWIRSLCGRVVLSRVNLSWNNIWNEFFAIFNRTLQFVNKMYMLVTRQIELLHLATYEFLKLLSVAFHFSASYTPYSKAMAIFVISFVYVN